MTTLESCEFSFVRDGRETEYRAMFTGTLTFPTVVLTRYADASAPPIGFDVPRTVALAKRYESEMDVVRDAIGQAVVDRLFDSPQHSTVYLRADAPRWDGKLREVR